MKKKRVDSDPDSNPDSRFLVPITPLFFQPVLHMKFFKRIRGLVWPAGFESGFGFKAVGFGFGFGFKKKEKDSDSAGFGFEVA